MRSGIDGTVMTSHTIAKRVSLFTSTYGLVQMNNEDLGRRHENNEGGRLLAHTTPFLALNAKTSFCDLKYESIPLSVPKNPPLLSFYNTFYYLFFIV